MNILLTGYPRVGKTTTVKKIVKEIKYSTAGFYTEEIRNERNTRVGFKIITIHERKEGLLAHVDSTSNRKVGKYSVLVDEFEKIAIPEMEKEAEIIVIDEIGKMELFSNLFKKKLLECLNKGNVLATITMRGGGKFVERIKNRNDVELIELTVQNRDRFVSDIIEKLNERIKE